MQSNNMQLRLLAFCLSLGVVLTPALARAQTTCAPVAQTVHQQPPFIDGVIDPDPAFGWVAATIQGSGLPSAAPYDATNVPDPGWGTGTRIPLGAGGMTTPLGWLLLGTNPSSTILYVGGIVSSAGLPPALYNTIVIGVSNSGSPSGLAFVIQPFVQGQAQSAAPPSNALFLQNPIGQGTLSGNQCPSGVNCQNMQYASYQTATFTSAAFNSYPGTWSINSAIPSTSWVFNSSTNPSSNGGGFAYAIGTYLWSFEMAIPINGSGTPSWTAPASGNLQLYFGIMTDLGQDQAPPGSGTGVTELEWPQSDPILGSNSATNIEQMFPSTGSSWGTLNIGTAVNLSTTCGGGLYITQNDIVINNVVGQNGAPLLYPKFPTGSACSSLPTTVTDPSAVNTFQATVHNTYSSSVPGVSVRFRISNFGIVGNEWAQLQSGTGVLPSPSNAPVSNSANQNPSPPLLLNAGSAASPSSATAAYNFELSEQTACNDIAAGASVGHYCLGADIFGDSGAVPVIAQSAQVNAWWTAASSATYSAIVSANGLGAGNHVFELTGFTQTFPAALDTAFLPQYLQPPPQIVRVTSVQPGAANPYETMKTHVVGWLDTGKTVPLHGVKKEVYVPWGDYYLIARHAIITAPSSPTETIAVNWQKTGITPGVTTIASLPVLGQNVAIAGLPAGAAPVTTEAPRELCGRASQHPAGSAQTDFCGGLLDSETG